MVIANYCEYLIFTASAINRGALKSTYGVISQIKGNLCEGYVRYH